MLQRWIRWTGQWWKRAAAEQERARRRRALARRVLLLEPLETRQLLSSAPTITAFPNATLSEDGSQSFAFRITDVETPAVNLTVAAVASNPTLLPASAFTFTGTGADRTLRFA